MILEDYIGLTADEAVMELHSAHPHAKIVLHPTMAPRYKGKVCLSKAMVVRQRLNDDNIELTVVMVD